MNPPLLDVDRIRAGTSGALIGSDLRYFPSIDSTNRLGRQLPEGEWRNGTVLITDFQSEGRGRQDRIWVAPPGSSLLLSVLLQAQHGIDPARLMMMAALSVADAIEETGSLQTTLKWPNDVLLNGRKVSGILAEHSSKSDDRFVLGIGLNANFHPSEIKNQEVPKGSTIPTEPTSISQELGEPVERETLALALFNRLNLWYSLLTKDPQRVFSAWTDRLETVGSPIEVSESTGRWEGVATGVQQDGALVVQDDEGKTHVLYAADVSLRQLPKFAGP